MARAKSSELWSYSAGEKGRNRVRAYERAARGSADRGSIFLQFVEQAADGTLRRKRVSLGRWALLFLRSVGMTRPIASLGRRDWDTFIRDRRSGALRPPGTPATHRVRDRQIQYDCKTINAMNDRRGRPLVDRHPFAGLPMPREESPRRPRLGDGDYQRLLKVAGTPHPQFRLALVLAHETGHRIGAIRTLSWFEVNLNAKAGRWRAECGKLGFDHTTALTAAAVTELKAAKGGALNAEAWVFPAPEQQGQPTSRFTFRHWWDAAEVAAKLKPVERRGWHSLRRSFAPEMKHAPLKDLAYLGGWKSAATIVEVLSVAGRENYARRARVPSADQRGEAWLSDASNGHLERPPRVARYINARWT